MSTFQELYAQQRENSQTHIVRKPSQSKLTILMGYLKFFSSKKTKKTLNTIKGYRRGTMYLGGFGFIAYAGWLVFPPLGFLLIGISLFLLDALIGDDE
jgi:hypothetical protein